MKIIDRGGGTPVVVIPGIQGRWEWMKPAIDALAQRCRVITFSLADEPSCGGDSTDRGFWCHKQVRGRLTLPTPDAAIRGLLRRPHRGVFAARYPIAHHRCCSFRCRLVEARRAGEPYCARYACSRRSSGSSPGCIRSCRRAAGFGRGFLRPRHGWSAVSHVFTGPHGAAWRLLDGVDFRPELVAKPTPIITGEPSLDALFR
jgi:hypothetical protein